MAADPMTLSDSRSMRAGTGIGIAIAVAATVGAIAFLAPRLREEMHEDIFSGAATAKGATPAARTAPAPATSATSATPAPEPVTAPVALKPATRIVPPGSLGPGETEIVAAPASPAPATHGTKAGHRRAHAVERKKPIERMRNARAPAPRLVIDDTPVRPLPASPAYRERVVPRRDANRSGHLVGGIPREDPFDYRTWRMHRNPDAPSTSPVERQPG